MGVHLNTEGSDLLKTNLLNVLLNMKWNVKLEVSSNVHTKSRSSSQSLAIDIEQDIFMDEVSGNLISDPTTTGQDELRNVMVSPDFW